MHLTNWSSHRSKLTVTVESLLKTTARVPRRAATAMNCTTRPFLAEQLLLRSLPYNEWLAVLSLTLNAAADGVHFNLALI